MERHHDTTRRFLQRREERRLLEALEILYGFQGSLRDDYAPFVTGVLRDLLEADLADYGEFHPRSGALGRLYWTPGSSYQTRVEAHLAHMHLHPVFALEEEFYGERVLGNRHFYTDRMFQQTPIFRDSFYPDGLRHFLNICVGLEGWVVSHGVYRAGAKGFTRREEALFAAFYPHLRNAYFINRARSLVTMTPGERIRWLFPDLSVRLHQVFEGIARGETNLEIARRLNLEVNTIKTYQKELFQRMGVNSRTRLAVLLYQQEGSDLGGGSSMETSNFRGAVSF